MTDEQIIAPVRKPCAVAVVANFGPIVGREPTNAELERLARRLLAETPSISVVAERRVALDLSGTEGIVHQVRVEIDEATGDEPDVLGERIERALEYWVDECRHEPGGRTLAERLAREAVAADEDEPAPER